MNRAMCIFDLDGTLNLTDARLSAEILKLSRMGVIFVVSTGRSIDYVLRTCIKNNIIPPKYIIADNGGIIYDVTKKDYLKRTILPSDKRRIAIDEFLNNGGKVIYIRYSDGNNTHVVDDENVRTYYANETVIYHSKEDIIGQLLMEDIGVTKITLAGDMETMKKFDEAMKQDGVECFLHGGSTSFPKEEGNYRIDITNGETSKGEGVRFLENHLGIHKFICIGNGHNDFSMLSYAIDTGNQAVVVTNFKNGKMVKDSEELLKRVREYAEEKGRNGSLIVATYPVNGLIGLLKKKEYDRGIQGGQPFPIVRAQYPGRGRNIITKGRNTPTPRNREDR